MAFGQLTGRESLRDTLKCLAAHREKLYHAGVNYLVNRLAEANEKRNWLIYAEFAQVLIFRARDLYLTNDFGLEISNTYALDSTTIDLC